MLELLRQLLFSQVRPGASVEGARDPALRVAAAALFVEVSRSDGRVTDAERKVMAAAVQGALGLSAAATEDLLVQAERESRQAASVYEFTRVVDQELSFDQKKRVVELLWAVAFADREVDPQEEARVRQIAGLLHVPHSDFIEAKIRARAGEQM